MSRMRSIVVSLDQLRPNPWNPNVMNDAMYRKELASLRKFGYVNPIISRELDDHYQIIDGEHRWKGLRQLGQKEAEIVVLEDLSEEEAKQLTIVLNETRGKPDPAKLGVLLGGLLDTVPRSDLLDLLPISVGELDRLAGLEDFDWGSLDQPRPESSGWVERTYRLPADAASVIDQAIAHAKDGEELPDWQALEAIAADYLSGVTMSATPSRQPTAPASSAARR